MNRIKNKHNPGKFAFIDASNIIYGCKTTGWKMDFEKLVEYLKTRYEISRIFYYAGLNADNKKHGRRLKRDLPQMIMYLVY